MFAPIWNKPVISPTGMQVLCEQDMGTRSILKDLRISNLNRIIFGHLNHVSSLRNKFDTDGYGSRQYRYFISFPKLKLVIPFQAPSLCSTVYLKLSDLIEMIKVEVLCCLCEQIFRANN